MERKPLPINVGPSDGGDGWPALLTNGTVDRGGVDIQFPQRNNAGVGRLHNYDGLIGRLEVWLLLLLLLLFGKAAAGRSVAPWLDEAPTADRWVAEQEVAVGPR